MASPTVETTALTATNGTSHALTLPASIAVGDLLIYVMTTDGGGAHTVDAGYNEIFDNVDFSSNSRTSVAWRTATADSNDDISIGTAAGERGAGIVYRISGAEDPATQAPEMSSSTGNTAQSNSPDPDAVTPTGGSKDYLYLAAMGCNDARSIALSGPSGFANFLTQNPAGGANGCNVATAELQETSASQDPGTFALDGGETWVAFTIAVHPPPTVVTPLSWRPVYPDRVRSTLGQPVNTAGLIPPCHDEGEIIVRMRRHAILIGHAAYRIGGTRAA